MGLPCAAVDLDELYDRQKRAAIAALQVWMDGVIGEGKARLAPILEGTLRGSGDQETTDLVTGRVIEDVWTGPVPDRVEIVGYFSTPYAQRQHQEPDYQHPRGGGPYYLEAPFKARLGGLEPLVARAVEAVTP